MKTLKMRIRQFLIFFICVLSVGKSVAQDIEMLPIVPLDMNETLPMAFVYPKVYSELREYDSENFDLRLGLQACINNDYARAVPYLQRAAKQGEGIAMAVLGDMYARGHGVKVDRQIAMNMFNKGVQAQCPLAYCYRGELYRREGKSEEALAEYRKAYILDSDCLYALWLNAVYYWMTGEYEKSMYDMDLIYKKGVSGMAGTLGTIYAEGKVVPVNYEKAFDYLTKDDAKYINSELLTLAELYYYGRGTGEKSVKKSQSNGKYTTYYYKNGESGCASITDALIILERLLDKGYEPARDLYITVKAEYEERERLSNVVEPPMLTDEGKRYLQRNPNPRRPGIIEAGYGEIIVTARISSSGQVTNVSLKKRVLVPLDEAALAFVRSMPAWKAGKKGGYTTDMNVNIGITFFPSYSVRIKGYSVAR